MAPGLPAFNVVGLADKAVSEARERVRAALVASGLALPARRITVNLAPADLPKEGSHYDLPIALGLMAAIGAIPPDALSGFTVLGELGLDGSIAAMRACCRPRSAPMRAAKASSARPPRRRSRLGEPELEIIAAASLIQLANIPPLWSGRGQKAPRAPTEIAQVHPTLVGGGRQTRGQAQRLVELGPGDGGLLAHVAQNRDLRSARRSAGRRLRRSRPECGGRHRVPRR